MPWRLPSHTAWQAVLRGKGFQWKYNSLIYKKTDNLTIWVTIKMITMIIYYLDNWQSKHGTPRKVNPCTAYSMMVGSFLHGLKGYGIWLPLNAGGHFNIRKIMFPGVGILTIKTRQYWGHLIFKMEIVTLVRWHLYMKSPYLGTYWGPVYQHRYLQSQHR